MFLSISKRFGTPRHRVFRTVLFVLLGLSGLVPVLHGVALYGYQVAKETVSLDLILAMGAMYLLGYKIVFISYLEPSFCFTYS